MSAKAGWFPDPGGGQGLYRYWDGKAWSAATSPNPSAPPPAQGLVGGASQPAGQPVQGQPAQGQPVGGQPYGQNPYGQAGSSQNPYGQNPYGQGAYGQSGNNAYANYQQTAKKRSPVGWWIVGAVLVVVIVIVAVVAVRAVNSGVSGVPGGQASQDICPPERTETAEPVTPPNDGRVHGGPISYPELGSPWGSPKGDNRVPFGVDVQSQSVTVQTNYQMGKIWVASILIGELQAGDGFFTPEQGSQIVVKCILGRFYDDNPVTSDVKINEKATIDGHDAWIVESQLKFDIKGLETKGELLIVAIVSNGERSGLYYASIPDTVPELIQPARDALKNLTVD
ncbi:MAG TPA: DUF2510 domain-containing protein [Propionibacteriaceae bacterium]